MKSFDDYREIVETHLTDYTGGLPDFTGRLSESMEYSLMAGGKRLRPVLLLASCDLFGGDVEEAVPFAVAMEYIHTYSLIHDDLPAMDDDDMRRGKKTNHVVYGPGMATLSGDGLLSTAFEVLSGEVVSAESGRMLPRARAMREIAEAAGIHGMVAGQAADIESEDSDGSEELLYYIEDNKTAALMKGAVRAGSLLGGASDADLDAMTRYADLLGTAFQIADDILDVEGDPEEIGKPLGSDEEEHKFTYISLIGLEGARKRLHELTLEAEDTIEALEGSDFFVKLVSELEERKK